MPTPLPKTNQLVQEINAMILHPRNEARLEEICAEAKRLEQVSYYQAKQIEGMVAGMRGDSKTTRTKFNAALISSGNDFTVRVNFAQALANLHCVREAAEHIRAAVELAPDNIEVVLLALNIHRRCFDIEMSEHFFTRMSQLGAEEKIPSDTRVFIDEERDKLDLAGTTWQEVSERIEQAAEVLFARGLTSSGYETTFTDSGVLFGFFIFGDATTVADAERAIHEKIAALPFSKADLLISFCCMPAE